MPKAKERDGVYYRKDRAAWAVSYIDASGERKRRVVAAHTRQQAVNVLSAIKTAEERARTLGVRPASEVTMADLFTRYKRYQKARIRPTTFERLGGHSRNDQTASAGASKVHHQNNHRPVH